MRIGTVRVLLFVLVLSLFAADYTVGCGQGYVYGPVTQKFRNGQDSGDFVLAVNGEAYSVPQGFWNSVGLGDTVRFTGREWEIVKTAQGVTPASTP
ncbi:MAG TPA: hypothetical protein VKV57_07680 [bacterium]|nr:hypothetical protein [bacterium]